MVLEERRIDRQLPLARSRKVINRIASDGGFERDGLRLKIGNKLTQGARIKDGSGKGVGADFVRFLEDVDVFRAKRWRRPGIAFLNQLRQPQRATESCGPGADNQHVGFKGFAGNVSHGSVGDRRLGLLWEAGDLLPEGFRKRSVARVFPLD